MSPNEIKKITINDFNNFSSKDDLINKWLEYFQSIGLAIDDIDNWRDFINVNSHSLYLEAKYYGLDRTNPFFAFLSKFIQLNKAINILTELYNTLHNLVARGSIAEKQLSFTCPEDEQIRVLVNKNLYKNNPNDFKYLIRCYNWLLELDIERDIKNKYIVDCFKEQNKVNDNLVLIRNIFFSDAITKFMTSDKSQDNKNVLVDSLFKNHAEDSLISTSLISCDTIEQNIKWLNENVQESGRNINGQYQQKESDKNAGQNKNSKIYMSPNEIKTLKDKITPVLDSLAQKANIGNGKAADIIRIIKQLY